MITKQDIVEALLSTREKQELFEIKLGWLGKKIVNMMANKYPIMILSSAGLGKTSTINNIAKLMGIGIDVLLGSIREPVDFLGIPTPTKNGSAKYLAFEWVHKVIETSNAIQEEINFYEHILGELANLANKEQISKAELHSFILDRIDEIILGDDGITAKEFLSSLEDRTKVYLRQIAGNPTYILFFDELTTSHPQVQNAMLRIILEGVVGEVKLPDSVFRIGAGNPSEQTVSGEELTLPLSNRFQHIHLFFHKDYKTKYGGIDVYKAFYDSFIKSFPSYWGKEPDLNVFYQSKWATARNIVTSFLQDNADEGYLHVEKMFDVNDVPADAMENLMGRPWPSPRTWDTASRIIAKYLALVDSTGSLDEIGLIEELSNTIGRGNVENVDFNAMINKLVSYVKGFIALYSQVDMARVFIDNDENYIEQKVKEFASKDIKKLASIISTRLPKLIATVLQNESDKNSYEYIGKISKGLASIMKSMGKYVTNKKELANALSIIMHLFAQEDKFLSKVIVKDRDKIITTDFIKQINNTLRSEDIKDWNVDNVLNIAKQAKHDVREFVSEDIKEGSIVNVTQSFTDLTDI